MAKRNPIAHHRCSPSRKRPSRPARRRQLARCWRQDAASFSRRIQDHPQLTRPPANEALHDRPNHEQSDHVEDQVRKVGVKHGSGEQTPPLAIRCTWSEIGAPPDQIPRRKDLMDSAAMATAANIATFAANSTYVPGTLAVR
jgi:hypothetical protein